MLYSQYLDREETTMEQSGDQNTVEVMQAILNVNNTKKSCLIMWKKPRLISENKYIAHCYKSYLHLNRKKQKCIMRESFSVIIVLVRLNCFQNNHNQTQLKTVTSNFYILLKCWRGHLWRLSKVFLHWCFNYNNWSYESRNYTLFLNLSIFFSTSDWNVWK